MLKDESNPSYSSQQRSPNQSSYPNILTQASPLHTPSSDHHDADALSDAGTYIIEDDLDIARDDEPEPDIDQPTQENQIEQPTTSNAFKRYAKTKHTRHGTFDIHALTSSPSTATTTQTVNRPIVDLNIPTHDITSPSSSTSSANLSSSSSLLSLPTESDNSTRKEPEGASHYLPDDSTSSAALIYARQRPTSLSQQQQPQHRPITPPQSQLKPAECFGKNRHPAVKTMNNFEFFSSYFTDIRNKTFSKFNSTKIRYTMEVRSFSFLSIFPIHSTSISGRKHQPSFQQKTRIPCHQTEHRPRLLHLRFVQIKTKPNDTHFVSNNNNHVNKNQNPHKNLLFIHRSIFHHQTNPQLVLIRS